MPSTKEERDKLICSRYVDEGISAERLAIDTGLSTVAIRKILSDGKAVGQPRVKSVGGDKTVSPRHIKIGRKISAHRMMLGVDRTYYGKNIINWSTIKVSHVEGGQFNLSLMDLEDISRALKIPLAELLSSTESNGADSQVGEKSKGHSAPSDNYN